MVKKDLYIMGARVDPVTSAEALDCIQGLFSDPNPPVARHIVTLNPEIVLHAIRDEQYRRYINSSALSIPDGAGLLLASRIFNERIPERVAGVDLMWDLCHLAETKGIPIFLLGALERAQLAAEKLKKQFPALKIVGTDPGPEIKLKDTELVYDQDANQKILSKINQSGAQLLFVAFGAPKQEKWLQENLPYLPRVKMAMGMGGAFDYISGYIKRASVGWQKARLEWLYRLIHQPRRINRIFNATLKFLIFVIICRIRIATRYRPNVVGLIINNENKVLLVAPVRHEKNLWQFPQGGVGRGESKDKAIFREMREEIGTDKFEILKKIPDIYKYTWPKWAQRIHCYKGQSQTLYILRFNGQDSDFNLSIDKELRAWKWVEAKDVVSVVDGVRKPLAVKALKEIFPTDGASGKVN